MKKYHINYAHGRYLNAQEYCSFVAKNWGFDEVYSYRKSHIDSNFYNKNKHIIEQPRGAGYWIWKPYFIKKTFDKMNPGDVLVYSDSGTFYQNSPDPLFDLLFRDKQGILSFELKGLIEKEYTKKDAFVLMDLDNPKYTDSSQREATYIWLIKNDFTINLVDEYLYFAQNENIITDVPNITGDNYSTFKDHRHDQSIWSLLCKKYDVEPHRLISQWGLTMTGFPNDTYGQIALHHRNPM